MDTITVGYSGPAGVVFTPDDLLEIWRQLCLHPTPETERIRDKIKHCLEYRERNNGAS